MPASMNLQVKFSDKNIVLQISFVLTSKLIFLSHKQSVAGKSVAG